MELIALAVLLGIVSFSLANPEEEKRIQERRDADRRAMLYEGVLKW